MQNTDKPNMRMLFGFWVLICIVFAARTIFTGASVPLFGDTDDAMRMVVVQDLLNAQNWFDHTQYRLNTPFGADIHWSRLVDVPLAAMVWLFQPVFGDMALVITAWVWPLSLLFVLLYLSVRLTTCLVGPEGLLPAMVLPVLSAAVLVEFAPGRVDHHNVQIVLVLGLLYATVRAWENPKWAALAGIAAATSLAIGTEALPQIITAVAAFGLFYVLAPEKSKTLRWFGLAFGIGTLVHMFIYLPPQNWNAACDALSLVYVGAGVGVGAVFVVLSLIVPARWQTRLILGGVLGFSVVGVLLLVFPQCLSGPYGAMEPWLVENWLSKIIEAKPVWHSMAALPSYTIGIVVPPIAALLVLSIFILRHEKSQRPQWLILRLFLVVGILVVLAQVRGARLVAGMVAPVGAWAILAVRQRYLSRQSVMNAIGLLGTWLAFAGLAIAVLAGYILPRGQDEAPPPISGNSSAQAMLTRSACLQPDVFEDLASLPPENIMAPVDLGAHLLLFTPHSVVGAPYHRNQQGLIDTFRFFNAELSEARTIVEKRDISLIVTCPYLPEMNGFADADESSFIRTLNRGELPDWLEDFTLPGSILNVYGVKN